MPSEADSTARPRPTRSIRTTRDRRMRDASQREARYHQGGAAPRETAVRVGESPPDSTSVAALNVTVAIVLLILAAPLMILVAILVRSTSRGPALFAQERVGLDRRAGSRSAGARRRVDLGGQPVRIYKFRTMYFDREWADQVWTRPGDVRITRLGRVLRAYRIDELPQLFNVLKREMNVVGPRPEQVEIFGRLREKHERFPDRQRVLPGITGLSQVKCGYGGDDFKIRRKLAFDREYVARRSIWMDLRILLLTIPVVLLKKGAR